MIRDVELSDQEIQLLCFIKKQPNSEVDSLGGRYGLQGIYRNSIPKLITSMQRKKVLACFEHNKPDFANAWKYASRGQAPYKKVKTCSLSRLGQTVARTRCI